MGAGAPARHGIDDRGPPGAPTPPRDRVYPGWVSCENPGVTARPLLTVKQVIPPVRAGAVGRERLAGQLRRADTPLTVVVAPAGWGKTSLLSGWANDPAEKRRIAWVSLDERATTSRCGSGATC